MRFTRSVRLSAVALLLAAPLAPLGLSAQTGGALIRHPVPPEPARHPSTDRASSRLASPPIRHVAHPPTRRILDHRSPATRQLQYQISHPVHASIHARHESISGAPARCPRQPDVRLSVRAYRDSVPRIAALVV